MNTELNVKMVYFTLTKNCTQYKEGLNCLNEKFNNKNIFDSRGLYLL